MPPDGFEALFLARKLLNDFLKSRRQGLSARTIEFYRGYLTRASSVVGVGVSGHAVKQFLDSIPCSNGGKHAYYRALRTFYHWLYSPKSELGLDPTNNPMLSIDPPKVEKKILPSLTTQQLDYLIEQASRVRDKAIISLFADSGLRLRELANIELQNIDWQNRLIKVRCKGNKEGLAPFGKRTETLLKQWLSTYQGDTNALSAEQKVDLLAGQSPVSDSRLEEEIYLTQKCSYREIDKSVN